MADGGSLMGWNPLQRSLDRNTLKTDKLINSVEKLIKNLGEVAKAGVKGGAAGWRQGYSQGWSALLPSSGAPATGTLGSVSAIQNMYGGKGLGGHAKNPGQGYGLALVGSNGQTAQVALKGGQISQAGQPASANVSLLATAGNGGHGTSGTGSGGSSSLLSQYGNGGLKPRSGSGVGTTLAYAGFSTLMAGAGALKHYGDSQQQRQMLMELGKRSASFSTATPYAQAGQSWLNEVFGNGTYTHAYAMSPTDAMAAAAMRMRISGGAYANTMRDISVDRAYKSLTMINPTLSAENAAGAMADLLSPRTQNNARWLGLRSLYDKDHAYIGNAELTRRLFETTFGTSKVSPDRVSASLAQGQALFHNLSKLGIGAETFGSLSEYARAYAKATNAGLPGSKLDEMLERAGGTGPAAMATRKELERYGIPVDTALQKKKDVSALESGFDAELNADFTRKWEKHLDQVRDDTAALNEHKRAVEKATGALSASGGLAETADNWFKRLIGFFTLTPEERYEANKNGPLNNQRANNYLDLVHRTGSFATPTPAPTPSPSGSMANTHMIGQQGAPGDTKPTRGERLDQIHSMLTDDGPTVGGKSAKGTTGNKTDKTKKDAKPNKNKADKQRADEPSGGGINSVISFARAQIGKWYQWGGTGPDRFDCSGLTSQAYLKGAHTWIGRTTWDQKDNPKAQRIPISRKAVQPGDLIFTNDTKHVVMWTGGGFVQAPRTGRKVEEVRGWPSGITGIRRYLKLNSRGSNGAGMGVGGIEDVTGEVSGELQTVQPGDGGDISSEPPGGESGSVLAGLANSLGSVEEKDIFDAIFGGTGVASGSLHSAGGSHITSKDKADSGRRKPSKKSKGTRGNLPPAPKNTSARSNIKIGQKMAARYGWTGDEWNALYQLWMHESNWNHLAQNPGSGAYGIPQSMPGKKMASEGPDWRTNPETQIRWGLKYIKGRYGDPEHAWSHWQARVPLGGKDVGHWYDKGAWEVKSDTKAVVHKGEMIIPSKQADTIREVLVRENVQSAGRLSRGGGGVTFGDIKVNVNVHGGGGGASYDTHAAARQMARQIKVELAQLDAYEATAKGR